LYLGAAPPVPSFGGFAAALLEVDEPGSYGREGGRNRHW